MDLGLKDKVAIVLASSKGLGRAAAQSLAAEGARVAMCARGEAKLRESADALGAFWRAFDVRDEAAMKKFVADVQSKWGAVHILVNNCGGPPAGGAMDVDQKAWLEAIDANFLCAVRWSREVAPIMIRQKWGRIINIVSISVKQPIPNLALSNASRAGLVGFAKTLARELAPHNVLVNNVLPGTHLTDRVRELGPERFGKDIPMGRPGQPEEFGPVVAFLASERASYICGTSLLVDGGAYAGY